MKRLLLDSHVLLWWADEPKALSMPAREAIADGRHLIYVSVATLWELGIKEAAGKLRMPQEIGELLKANRFDVIPITADHVSLAVGLPPIHRDPFDRMLVSQARIERLTLVTRDEVIAKYDVPLLAA